MFIKVIRTPIFKQKESIINFIHSNIKNLQEKTVLVVTSKIVALSEGRVREIKNSHTREQIIKSESQWALKTEYTWLTIKDKLVMSSAGIDESNADGKIILLPKDSFQSALDIRNKLKKIYKIKNLGVIITDSRLLPLRAGVIGVALGYAGFKGVRDYRGTSDIFGRTLKLSRTDIADSLAATAVLGMGEGAERQPLAVITKAPIEFVDKINRRELEIDIKNDIYRPLFEKIRSIKWKN